MAETGLSGFRVDAGDGHPARCTKRTSRRTGARPANLRRPAQPDRRGGARQVRRHRVRGQSCGPTWWTSTRRPAATNTPSCSSGRAPAHDRLVLRLRRSLRTILETSEPVEREPLVSPGHRPVKVSSVRVLRVHAGRRNSAQPLCGRTAGHFRPIGQRWGRARRADQLICADCLALAPLAGR